MKDVYEGGQHISGQKSSVGGRGNPEKASPAAIERYIKGASFPASKKDLISQAQKNSAPDDVMSVLRRFAEKQYNNVTEIAKEVGRAE